jgi:hypothetical protein
LQADAHTVDTAFREDACTQSTATRYDKARTRHSWEQKRAKGMLGPLCAHECS